MTDEGIEIECDQCGALCIEVGDDEYEAVQSDYWEGRAEKAEARVAELEAAIRAALAVAADDEVRDAEVVLAIMLEELLKVKVK